MKTFPLPHLTVFVAGLAIIAWIATGYAGSNLPALAVTVLIAALYLTGALELHRYRQATASLAHALDALPEPPAALAPWLATLHPSLRGAVQLRVEDGRAALPSPALTPYLVGMLVLLGMLGTLLGMVLALRGTGMALQTATDLQAMRDSLGAPVSGLGVAFGASIAGVAGSAMLGLLSALCRRERIDVAQRLDAHIANGLRPWSHAWQRERQAEQQYEQTLALLQQQAGTLPALVERLDAMSGAIERQAEAAHARQAEQQAAFHADTRATWTALADSVRETLERSAADSARAAGQALQPALDTAMRALAHDTAELRATVEQAVQQQLQAVSSQLAGSSEQIAGIWQQALDRAAHDFATHAAALLRDTEQAHARLQASLAEQDGQRLAAWREDMATMAAGLRQAWANAGEEDAARQQAICDTLAATAQDIGEQARASASATIAEIGTLVQAAADAPRVAAEVMAELRQKLSDSMARDTAMLEERTRLLGTLDTLLDAVNHASTEQRGAIDALVSTSADLLERIGTRFGERIETETGRLDAAAERVDAGATEVAAMAEAFATAVQAFGDSSTGLAGHLERIEAALDKTLTRSDEQLAYYVAQAREVVDLSVLSQQQIIGNLQRLTGTPDNPAGADAA